MKTAIVILNWNGLDLLKEFLPSVVQWTPGENNSIIVADNGSQDTSIDWLSDNYPGVKIIRLDSNYGFAGGYNRALKDLDAEYFVLLNSDVELSKNWLSPMIDYMDKDENVAACQPKILSYKNRNYFEHAGAAGGYIDKYGYPYCRGRVLDNIEEDKGQYNSIADIFWASGACLCIRASVWKETGGFDQDFFAHMEEIDLCWRIHGLGYRIVAIPESIVYHLGGGTLSYLSPKKIYYNFRNSLYLLHKNLPQKGRNSILFKRKLLDGLAALVFLLSGRFKAFSAVFNSHISYYKSIKSLNKKRDLINTPTTLYPDKLILGESIALNYNLKRKLLFDNNRPS